MAHASHLILNKSTGSNESISIESLLFMLPYQSVRVLSIQTAREIHFMKVRKQNFTQQKLLRLLSNGDIFRKQAYRPLVTSLILAGIVNNALAYPAEVTQQSVI